MPTLKETKSRVIRTTYTMRWPLRMAGRNIKEDVLLLPDDATLIEMELVEDDQVLLLWFRHEMTDLDASP